MSHPNEDQHARLILRVSNSVAKVTYSICANFHSVKEWITFNLTFCGFQLTEIVENINGEFDEIEAQTGDIVCVHELWSRYMKKVGLR